MTYVTDYFGITAAAVPFVNVHVERDNRIFLDPSAIRNGSDPYSVQAHAKLVDYFNRVVAGVTSTNPATRRSARALLNHLHEPNETRFGMSVNRPKGSAFGDELAQELWDELERNPACQHAVLTRLEETRLFVDFVGVDRISDLATRVVFDILAAFTADMMTAYPNLNAGAVTASSHIWDRGSGAWVPRDIKLPFADHKQLLLVPKHWVYWRTLMDATPFYNRYATEAIANERSFAGPKGKRVRPSKKSIKADHPNVRKLNNEKAVQYKVERDRNLVSEYRTYVDNTFEPLSDSQIRARIE